MEKVTYTINTMLAKDMTIGQVFEMANKIKRAGGAANTDIDRDLALAVQYLYSELSKYRFNDSGYRCNVRDFYRMRKIVDEDFLQNHRLNYATYYVITYIVEWMEDKKMVNFTTKKYWKRVQDCFRRYQLEHKKLVDHSAWMTTLDHMRLVYDSISSNIEPFEFSIRDYLIQKRKQILDAGQKDDITLLTKTYVALMFCAALRNTRKNFFDAIWQQKGIDLSVDFAYSDIDGVCRNFVWMMQTCGIKFVKDSDGDDVPAGVDIAQSVRVESEWNNIVRILTDAELMDETALKAINMNPETKRDYEAIVAQAEQREMDNAINMLKQQENVSAL